MLTLPIKKKWFDMILSGEKKEEYREIKPYYETRFKNIFYTYKFVSNSEFIIAIRKGLKNCKFEVCFRNGYSKNSSSFIAKCTLSVGEGKEEWGAEPQKEYYILRIHEVVEKKNC